jgi:hypothetical protein
METAKVLADGMNEGMSKTYNGFMSVFKQEIISVKDAVEFMSYISPIIISAFLLLTSLSNADVKALIWLAFAIWGMLIIKFIKPLFVNYNVKDQGKCKIRNAAEDTPSTSAFFLMFTIAYMFFPMMVNKSYNILILVGLMIFFGIDVVVKIKNSCTGFMGIGMGALFGVLWGGSMYAMMHNTGGEKYTYFSVGNSNNTYCSKPKSQTFKCNVYKNGQIISTL